MTTGLGKRKNPSSRETNGITLTTRMSRTKCYMRQAQGYIRLCAARAWKCTLEINRDNHHIQLQASSDQRNVFRKWQ